MLDLFSSEHISLVASHNRGTGNQEILDANRKHFQGQALKVLEHLLKGERVSGSRMFELYRIQDIRPRIAMIKKYYPIGEEKIKGGHGAKEWYLQRLTVNESKQ